jgi:hypothetical protein
MGQFCVTKVRLTIRNYYKQTLKMKTKFFTTNFIDDLKTLLNRALFLIL